MFKVKNIDQNNDIISLDFQVNRKDEEWRHLTINASTFDVITCEEQDPYMHKVISVLKHKIKTDGELPNSFVYATH